MRRAAALFIAGYFLAFAGHGLWAYFVPDDMMNLYAWWSEPVWKLIGANLLYCSPANRPMGGIFYTSIFALFGLNPLPFRAAALALMLANIFLLYAAARRLTGSRETAALAALIGCYNPWFFGMYESTAAIYDVLCFTFYFGALAYHLKLRQAGRPLQRTELLLVVALYASALNSKEMAVTLPVMLGACELFLFPRKLRDLRAPWIAALMTVPFIIGKTLLPGPYHLHPAYTPHFTIAQFRAVSPVDLGEMLHGLVQFNWTWTVLVWLLLAAIAWFSRIPALRFSWLLLFIAPLPVVFLVPRRGGFNLYLPYAGWALYAAILLVKARQQLFGQARVAQLALFVGTAVLLVPANLRVPGDLHWVARDQQIMRDVLGALQSWNRPLPHGARLLFTDDPVPADALDYTIYFATSIYYRDKTVRADRARLMRTADPARYDYVLKMEPGRIIELKVPPVLPVRPVVPRAVTVRIENLTRPGAAFRVGDRFRVVVTGPPSVPVGVNASQNGSLPVWSIAGRTGPDGVCALDGVLAREHTGTWSETWTVGGAPAGRLEFQVRPWP